MRLWKCVPMMTLLLLLAACGGGAGGEPKGPQCQAALRGEVVSCKWTDGNEVKDL